MKTTDPVSSAPFSSRYLTAAITLVLISALYSNSAIAQDGRRGSERHATAGDGGRRQSTIRQQPSIQREERRGRDVAIDRENSSRDFNRNRNPAAIERGNIPSRNNNSVNTDRNLSRDRNNNFSINRDRNINRNLNDNRNVAGRQGYNSRPVTGSLGRPGYRPVYGYNRRPVYNRYNPSWRYSYLPRRNSYFYSLPTSYLSFNFGGIGYRYWDGVFYRPYNNLFTVIAPPVGIYINILPVGYRRIYVHNYPYYYYNGTYYDQRESNYYVVSPPVGAVVESLPAGYDTVVIDGETFYTADGAQYKPVIQENGEIWYEVIKANS